MGLPLRLVDLPGVRRATDLLPRESPEPRRSTGLPELDEVLGGGLARGELTEVVGRPSGGRASLAMSVLAAVTGGAESAAMVDLGDGFDPASAAAFGVDVARLLHVRPRRLEAALAATDLLVRCGFPLVVLDLGLPPVPGRRSNAAWVRLARDAEKTASVVLVLSPYRISGAVAPTVLGSAPGRTEWLGTGRVGALLHGRRGSFVVERQRGHSPGQRAGWTATRPGQPIASF